MDQQAVDQRAVDLLCRHGYEPGDVLGSGMEGTVVDLSSELVAKIWHGRTEDDLAAGVTFGTALGAAALPFGTPQVTDLLADGGCVITIEQKVRGVPLRHDRISAPPIVTPDEVRILGDALSGLADATLSPGLAALPILPGEQPFGWPGSFSSSLAQLTDQRYKALPELLQREVDGIDTMVSCLVDRLQALGDDQTGLVHGDLIPANVMVEDGHVSGVLDFGFMTAVGDPQFDAAVTASLFDMYGPNAKASEDVLTEAFLARFGHDRQRYGLYRAAFAIITNAYFGSDGADGHFWWCAQMLRRPDVRAAVLG
ncbi:MAG TPA: aminoglycoside phosphotransferase family protein [Microlunatus sp.]